MKNVVLAAHCAQGVAPGVGDADDMLKLFQGPHLDIVQVRFLDTGEFLQFIEVHPLDDVLLNHETIALVLNLIQYDGDVHFGLCPVGRVAFIDNILCDLT